MTLTQCEPFVSEVRGDEGLIGLNEVDRLILAREDAGHFDGAKITTASAGSYYSVAVTAPTPGVQLLIRLFVSFWL